MTLPVEAAYERWQRGEITQSEYDAIKANSEARKQAMREAQTRSIFRRNAR